MPNEHVILVVVWVHGPEAPTTLTRAETAVVSRVTTAFVIGVDPHACTPINARRAGAAIVVPRPDP
ncbi:hypothetical protein AB0M47_23190 [Hamadaea sp. NPDC051192]|uniref:hypothetical protein n=1 Tax=Hamadaea sp. NPDC051192 TaxID=3154940 RepID=UPI003412E6AD